MNVWGRKVFGWVAAAAFALLVFTVAAGVLKPSALGYARPVLCPRAGQEVSPGGGTALRVLRESADSPVAVFCSSDGEAVQNVTDRWVFLCVGLGVTTGLALLVRSKVTPPSLRAPVVPVAH